MLRRFQRRTRRKQLRTKRKRTRKKTSQVLEPFWVGKINYPKVDTTRLTDTATWRKHLGLAKSIWNKSGRGEGTLRKGTFLYHGSGKLNPVKNLQHSGRPFFFGLDAYIAMWYTLESSGSSGKTDLQILLDGDIAEKTRVEKNIKDLSLGKWTAEERIKMKEKYEDKLSALEEKQAMAIAAMGKLGSEYSKKPSDFHEITQDLTNKGRRYYFLNIYETTEDIEYKYLDAGVTEVNPLDVPECADVPCLHPQFGYHGHTLDPPVELSMELTIPTKMIPKAVRFVKALLIDVSILRAHARQTFPSFKAAEAIVDLS